MEEAEKGRVNAPGLKWIKRRASYTPTWVASVEGYEPRTRNLAHLRDRPEELVAQCVSLQAAMNAWKAGLRRHVAKFDSTISYYLKKYQTDEDSTYHSLRPGSRHPYDHYLAQLELEIGDLYVDQITGIDVKRWHESWSEGGEHLAASKMCRAVLDAAIAYGVMSHPPGSPELRAASDLREVLKAASRKLPSPKRREFIVTAEDVARLRKAAHDDGRPSMALAYALVFETTLRLWDVIGQWWPMGAPGVSDVLSTPHRSQRHTKKWFGLRWEDIGPDLVLRFVPSKTSVKTGLAVTYPITKAPMVMEELEHWPLDRRTGPVVAYERTGLPYGSNYFGEFWRKDRDAAGLPKQIWARDLRASGITEGRASGVSTDDAAKVAGHASTKTTSKVYDRAALAAAERFADARAKGRNR